MSKELVVGDPHATVEDLADCGSLLSRVRVIANEASVDQITFLGDLFHNHALMNVKVLEFWNREIHSLSCRYRVVLLVGNHDMPGDGSSYPHALVTFKNQKNVVVVDEPMVIHEKAYLPYIQNPNLFKEHAIHAASFGCKTLICHQEFMGAKYDNGFFTPNGVDPDQIPFERIVSGHIHTPQRFGNVWYVGAPRWRTLADADVEERYLWLLTWADEAMVEAESFPTSASCRVIKKVVLTPESPWVPESNPKDLLHVTIEGPQAFITENEARVRKNHPKARVVTLASDERVIRVRESDGIPVAYRKYVEAYVPKYGTSPSLLKRLAQERLYV